MNLTTNNFLDKNPKILSQMKGSLFRADLDVKYAEFNLDNLYHA